jgi:uncharacterized protein (TIGR02757 family)
MKPSEIKSILEHYYLKYNQKGFIENDPISIPHRFIKKQDIEIAGFFAAIFAWGQRITIINKCNEVMHLMEERPHDFILQHQPEDLKRFCAFKHRTFNSTDLLYFISFLQIYYQENESLEAAFGAENIGMKERLAHFHQLFFSMEAVPERTKKHIANPLKNSTCKRLNMYLRWMVRKDEYGVDLGIWNTIKMSELHCPLDVHVERMARKLGLITRKQSDWATVEELTQNLRRLNSNDPIRYDFALFGMGLENYNEL